MDIFSSPQIKNVATLVGNLANASPIGDTLPFLLVSRAIVHVASAKGSRKIPISDFFVAYRTLALKKGELIVGVEFEIPSKKEFLRLYKTSQRKDLDISAVSVALRMTVDPKSKKISNVLLAMGGVAATPIRLRSVEKILTGEVHSSELLEAALRQTQKEITPLDDLRGTSAFRRVIAENTLKQALTELGGA